MRRATAARSGPIFWRRLKTFFPSLMWPPLQKLLICPAILHQLKGDGKGFWAVTVRANWRIIFRFENGQAIDVELIDYH
jgi:toxin HigB-1